MGQSDEIAFGSPEHLHWLREQGPAVELRHAAIRLADDLAVGQVWRHKREAWRQVTIREVYNDGMPRAFVDRNTSRRKQAISISTLRRDYRPVGSSS